MFYKLKWQPYIFPTWLYNPDFSFFLSDVEAFLTWIIKGLRHQIAKIKGLKNQSLRL